MHLTSFEQMLVQDRMQVYKNQRETLLIDINIYKRDAHLIRDAIKHNDYKMYNVCKKWVHSSYKRMKVTALRVLEYMFVYARLG